MNLWKEYSRATSISEALKSLAAGGGRASLIAGGTDLILDLQQGRHLPIQTLVDISQIPELNLIEIRGDELFIGSCVVIGRIADSDLVIRNAQALAEACRLIGGPQVRNIATLGGNIAHALPAADGAIALMCLDTSVEVADIDRFYRIPLEEMFISPGKTILGDGRELISGFYVPIIKPGQASIFRRVMRMQGIALPILNLSINIQRESDRVKNIMISAGPSGGKPQRIKQIEDNLRGEIWDERLIDFVKENLFENVKFRSSPHRATSEYRHQVLQGLLEEALRTVWERTT